jgi:hypothetical protein
MSFQIVRRDLVHCAITDATLGTRAVALPMTYSSKELALKLAARRHCDEYEAGGDSYYEVVVTGTFQRVCDVDAPVATYEDFFPF